jgi:pyrroline-5-carboxylate reductase
MPAAAIQVGLGPQGRVVRAMPNTAAALQASTTAIAGGTTSTVADVARAELLFSAIGTTATIEEAMMDAATAVAGSGPAYVFYLAQAMIEGALAVGFDQQTAEQLVRSTISGAGRLLEARKDLSPQQLRAGVTSKGGTTAAAVTVLDQAMVIESVRRAIVAARDRGREIAQTAK